MSIEKLSRAIGIAVGELYKRAIVSHQGICYEVDTIDNGGNNLYFEEDVYRRMRRKLELFHPDFNAFMKEFPKKKKGQTDIEYLKEIAKRIKIIIPKKISCKISSDLRMFRCLSSSCGWFGPVSLLNGKRVCPDCGNIVVQAPIYRWDKHKDDTTVRTPDRFLAPVGNPPCKNHSKGKFHRLVATDFKTPISSLRLYCPECHRTPQNGRRLVRSNYKLGLPSTSLRRKIMISQAEAYEQEDWKQLDHQGLLSEEYIESIHFCDNMRVYQVTFGFSYETEHCFPLDDAAVGREFPTQGIIIQLKPDTYDKVMENIKSVYINDPEIFDEFVKDLERLGNEYFEDEEDERKSYNSDQLKRWVLHTLKHAFLMLLPLKTGLDYTKFAGLYDIDDNRVIIYDNEFGGIGGCQSLANDENLFIDYLDITRKRIGDCDCRSRCLKCLVTNYCGEVNNALNRHLIGPIFNIVTDYE